MRPEQQRELVRRIILALDQESQEQSWPHDKQQMRSSLVMACEHPKSKYEVDGGLPRTGGVIMSAIAEWLEAGEAHVQDGIHGFVVQHPGRVVHWFRNEFGNKFAMFTGPRLRPDLEDGWLAVDAFEGEWCFTPDAGRGKSFPVSVPKSGGFRDVRHTGGFTLKTKGMSSR